MGIFQPIIDRGFHRRYVTSKNPVGVFTQFEPIIFNNCSLRLHDRKFPGKNKQIIGNRDAQELIPVYFLHPVPGDARDRRTLSD